MNTQAAGEGAFDRAFPHVPEEMPLIKLAAEQGPIASSEVDMTFGAKLYKYGRSLRNLAVVGVAGAMYGFEQSPGNETLRGNVAGAILEHVHNPVASSALATAGVGVATMAIEMATVVGTVGALNTEGGVVGRFNRWVSDRVTKSDEANRGKNLTEFGMAIGIGATPVVVKKHYQSPNPSMHSDLRNGLKASTQISVFSAGIAAAATGGIELGSSLGLKPQAEWTVDRLQDWRTYAVIFGPLVGYKAAKAGINLVRNNRQGQSKQDTV